MKPFLQSILALFFSVSLFADERPNIVLIISDDHAWTDYTFMVHEKVRTPHIDRMAAEGLTFTRGYVTTALCSPSLATMLTGLYPHQHGITGNDPVRGLDREEWLDRFFQNPILPKQLADAGYLTLHTGKYWMRKPADAGFTDDIGETGRHGGKSLSIGRQGMDPIYKFIDKAKAQEKPFFVWYAPFLPHTPHNPPARLLDKYKGVKNAKYYAMVEWLDETCGDLMKNLKDKGVDDNTLIVYLADNGWNSWGKASPYENGIRTPFILRWPAKIKPKQDTKRFASNLDVVPTILTAAGVNVPCNNPGINLLDDSAVSSRKELFFENFSHNMVSPTEPGKACGRVPSSVATGNSFLGRKTHPRNARMFRVTVARTQRSSTNSSISRKIPTKTRNSLVNIPTRPKNSRLRSTLGGNHEDWPSGISLQAFRSI